MLPAYRAGPSTHAVAEAIGVTHQTVLRCLDRAARFGVMAALEDSPRPGKAAAITDEARAVGLVGLPEGQQVGVSERDLDHAAACAPSPRACGSGWTSLPNEYR